MKYLQNASLWLVAVSAVLLAVGLVVADVLKPPPNSLFIGIFATTPGSLITGAVGLVGLLVSWLVLRSFKTPPSFIPAAILFVAALLLFLFLQLGRTWVTDLESALKLFYGYGMLVPILLASVLSLIENAVRKLRKPQPGQA
ncbi:MAG: hypothetical protein Q4D73_06265 [Actinomycetaceae bacterium]|nr:hypothetical protein [Actinomycetaceae bacterium]